MNVATQRPLGAVMNFNPARFPLDRLVISPASTGAWKVSSRRSRVSATRTTGYGGERDEPSAESVCGR